MAFMVPAMSLVAERVRSVGVVSGASRLWRSSVVFVELFLLILFCPPRLFSSIDGPLAIRQRKEQFLPLKRESFFLPFEEDSAARFERSSRQPLCKRDCS